MDFSSLDDQQLLALISRSFRELRRRGVVRSSNNPAADYAEGLASRALGLEFVPKSTRGHDAVDPAGLRYEIKARRITPENGSTQTSVLRGLDRDHFDRLIGVLFSEEFEVLRAWLVPIEVVRELATYRSHVNGWVLHLRKNLWEQPGVIDLTEQVRDSARPLASA